MRNQSAYCKTSCQPSSYTEFFTKASDNTAVVSGNTQSFWTNHTMLSVGLSFLFDR